MLAQGQSSSTKRGGLAALSSGLIFLKKKKMQFHISSAYSLTVLAVTIMDSADYITFPGSHKILLDSNSLENNKLAFQISSSEFLADFSRREQANA